MDAGCGVDLEKNGIIRICVRFSKQANGQAFIEFYTKHIHLVNMDVLSVFFFSHMSGSACVTVDFYLYDACRFVYNTLMYIITYLHAPARLFLCLFVRLFCGA